MKKIFHILKNIGWFTMETARFAPLTFLLAGLQAVWNSAAPFVDILFPKWILDELTGQRRWQTVLLYISLWCIINAAMLFLEVLRYILSGPYSERLNVRMGMLYGKMGSHMDYGRFEMGSTHDEVNRISGNLSQSWFAYTLFNYLSMFIKLAGFTYIIATLHPLMIIFLLLIIAANALLARRRQKIQYKYQEDTAHFKRRFEYLFKAMISYPFAKEVRINKAAEWIAQKYGVETEAYINVYAKNQRENFGADTVSDTITLAQTVAMYAYSAYRVVKGAISLGSFSMYINSVGAFTGTFSQTVSMIHQLKFVSEYIDSYKTFVEKAVPSHEKKGVLDIAPSPTHEIEFENVSFKYPGCDNYVLKNVSVKIRSGERLSVVGYNGAGKTTFIKLICRLYEPTEGRILYNGVDVSTLKYDQYVKLLSVVFQDYNIYSLSVRENVCLAGSADDEAVLLALEQSGLSEKVKRLPRGLNTQVGREFDSEGIEFSGGEGQKLASARAYLRNAPIVILDEPTASLDPISESRLYERFNNIIGKKTAIYISHRLASVKFCDSIIVFENGQIVESGTHSELMAAGGVYSEMFTKQAEYYIEVEKGKAVTA